MLDTRRFVYTVHVARGTGLGAIETVFSDHDEARRHARSRSGDPGITAAVITRFVLNELGTRGLTSWFERGEEKTVGNHRGPLPEFRTETDAATAVG